MEILGKVKVSATSSAVLHQYGTIGNVVDNEQLFKNDYPEMIKDYDAAKGGISIEKTKTGYNYIVYGECE